MKTIKKVIILGLLILFIFPMKTMGFSGYLKINHSIKTSQNIRVYYMEDLSPLGYKFNQEEYNLLSSEEKEKVTSKLEAYIYKEGISAIENMELAPNSSQTYEPKKTGYYLLSFDKKDYNGKVLLSKSMLVYFNGENIELNVKSSLEEKKDLEKLDLAVSWEGERLQDKLWVGIYDQDGNLVGEIWLSDANNWRHVFKGLDPLKNYYAWPKLVEGAFFTEVRLGNTIYIKIYSLDSSGSDDKEPGGGIYWPGHTSPEKPLMPDEKNDLKHNEEIELGQGELDQTDSSNNSKDKQDKLEESKEDSKNIKKKVNGREKLPQTGQLWWPIPILIAIGIFLYILGLRREKND
ncbi:MAG: hypothetical protein ACTHWZ_02705 [Peptoniphilaceae bacterium]